VRQYCAWGPLFIPVYLGLAVVYGYRRHPMERAAVLAAAQYETGSEASSGDAS
jgi:hypothetical protein